VCGIAGIVGGSQQREDGLQRMLDALAHRGPDGEGTAHPPGAALGHRRLSIIDPQGSHQPLVNEPGTLWLVCNGEIYNYEQLRSELRALGYRFRTDGDCEVILGLYELYGDRMLERLRGMFALALWDAPRRRLLLARDHLGQKPLFYVEDRESLVFASELKALLAFDPSWRELDIRALDQYLALRLIAPPLTMFRRIRKLPPGHKLVHEAGRVSEISPYWKLRFLPKHTAREEDLIEELDQRLTEALRLHMVSDVPVGAFLSGGMDSSLIVAMLSKRLGIRGLPTFTIDVPHRRFSEAPYARAVAELCKTEHREVRLGLALRAALPDLVWHLDEPSDPLSLCMFALAGFARERVKVVLGGDGGDELFGGYDRYYGHLYADHYARVPSFVRRRLVAPMLAFAPESDWYKSKGHQLKWLHRASFLSGAQRYVSSLSYFYFDASMRSKLLSEDALGALDGWRGETALADRFESAEGDALDRMLQTDAGIRLPDHPVMITDRMTMAWGLEARSPFMDHRLVEFVARMPSALKVRGRTLRHIQRQLAARYLPTALLQRPKQGFSSALPYLLRDEYRRLYENLLPDSMLVTDGLLRVEAVRSLLEQHLSGRADHGNRLWLLLNAELWYRMHILGGSREDLQSYVGTNHERTAQRASASSGLSWSATAAR
jgi:asparagine synthase (glutamine-hydrolysing)